ncbi:MAG: hypothetical protein C0514_02290 [Candidatus Puniceispirillum sp.]|nr:hypothetical protein [Candidatus Puniceispirillum sp.]
MNAKSLLVSCLAVLACWPTHAAGDELTQGPFESPFPPAQASLGSCEHALDEEALARIMGDYQAQLRTLMGTLFPQTQPHALSSQDDTAPSSPGPNAAQGSDLTPASISQEASLTAPTASSAGFFLTQDETA